MSGVLDTIGDLAHHAYDAVTGAISPPSRPSKPAYSSQDASHFIGSGGADKAAEAINDRKSQIDKAVDDAS